jgi:hypothetical protein
LKFGAISFMRSDMEIFSEGEVRAGMIRQPTLVLKPCR